MSVKDYTRNFGNDYSEHFVRTGVLPQVHIQNIENPQVGYPKLQRLHELKEVHNYNHTSSPLGRQVELSQMSAELLEWTNKGASFDVILVGGCIRYRISELSDVLPIGKLSRRPSLLIICVESSQVESARTVMDHWGFRRSEDIVYIATSKESVFFPPNFDECLQKSSWHCLLGLKGTLRRSEDSDLIHCNVDTDVIVQRKSDRSNVIPERIYQVLENFTSMGSRLHIVPGYSGELPVRMRKGWIIMSPDSLLDNYHGEKIELRVPQQDEICSLRPRTPVRKN